MSKKPTRKEKVAQTVQTKPISKPGQQIPFNRYYLIIALVAALIYGNSLPNGYVLDDFSVVKENNIVNGGVANMGQIFKTSYRSGYLNVNDGLYRPLSLAMFAVEWSIAPDKPALGHFINLLVYIGCGILAFKVMMKLMSNDNHLILFTGVLLFMCHPIHTEVVGNIKSRDELLCFFFSFASILQALHYLDNKKLLNLLLAAFMLFIAFLAKESAILTLPLFLLMLLFFRRNQLNQALVALSVLLLPMLVYLLIRKQVLGSFAGIQAVTMIDNPVGAQENFLIKLTGSLQILGEYFQLFCFPHPLIYDYSYNSFPLTSGITFPMVTGILSIAVVAVAAVLLVKKQPMMSFALWFSLVSLSLYSNLFITIGAAKAERFAFLASLGFCVFLSLLLATITRLQEDAPNGFRLQHPYSITVLCIALLFSVKTIARNKQWASNITLYTHDVELNPASAKTHYYLGNELIKNVAEQEQNPAKKNAILQHGIDEVLKAVEIFPTYSDGLTQAGVGFYKMNKLDSAAYYFNKALSYNSNNSVALSNLGAYYFNKGRYNEAIEIYNKTLQLNPRFVDAMLNMGSCYGASGRYQEAITWFLKVLEISRNNDRAMSLLEMTYRNIGDTANAEKYKALQGK